MRERLARLGRHGPSQLSTRSRSPVVLSADSQGLVHHLRILLGQEVLAKPAPSPQQQINTRLPAQKPGEVSRRTSLRFIKLLAVLKTSAAALAGSLGSLGGG